MHFSRFSVVESLVSIHLAPLSGPLSRYRIYYSDTLHLCVPVDQDGTNVLRLGMLLIILAAFHSNPRRFRWRKRGFPRSAPLHLWCITTL